MPDPKSNPKPKPKFSPTTLTPHTFHRLLSIYPEVVERVYRQKLPSGSSKKDGDGDEGVDEKVREFLELDGWRYEVLPQTLRERRDRKDGEGERGMYMTKGELEGLMGWKLKHGTHRPTLLSLIRSNAEKTVQDATREAFTSYFSSSQSTSSAQQQQHAFPAAPLKTLCTLRGVGTATASLILAVADPENVLFFGDEVFAWMCRGCFPGGEGWHLSRNAKGREKRKGIEGIKYSVKEYEGLWEVGARVRERMGEGVGMSDVERVGFVVGNLGDEDDGMDEGESEHEEVEEREKEEDRRVLRKRKGEVKVEDGKGRKKRKGSYKHG